MLFLSGMTAGLGTAALLALKINEVPLPFIAPPTRDAGERNFLEPEEPKSENLQFQEILRNRTPPKSIDTDPEPANTGEGNEERLNSTATAFFIQIGAFNDNGAADRLKGELALLNIAAEVRRAASNGQTLYRVLAGPYETAASAERVQAQLAFNGYNTNLISARTQ